MDAIKLAEILKGKPEDIIKSLSVSSYKIPKWSDLDKQYDPMKHKIIVDKVSYPDKLNSEGGSDFKRTSLGLQKLAVNRISQSMFSSPVERTYDYKNDSDQEQNAVDIFEQIYSVDNYIDSENIERGKKLNASCQIVTVWRAVPLEKPILVKGQTSKFKLVHKTYSEKDGYTIYAQVDDNDDLLVVSLSYTNSSGVAIFDIYNPKGFIRLERLKGGWTETMRKDLGFMPCVYSNIEEPVWGGDAGTLLVEQLEEMESYQGMYIKKNALPTFTLDFGDTQGSVKTDTVETSSDSRRILRVGKGGSMKDVTWTGAGEAVNDRYKRIRSSFFEQCQMPDISFANLITSNTSAENKELLFSDAKAKAKDLGGEWIRLFHEETSIVKEFLKVFFPSLASVLDNISIDSVIRPYNVNTRKENAEYVSTAGDSMSLETKVRILGEVSNVKQEVEDIRSDASADTNNI